VADVALRAGRVGDGGGIRGEVVGVAGSFAQAVGHALELSCERVAFGVGVAGDLKVDRRQRVAAEVGAAQVVVVLVVGGRCWAAACWDS